MSKKSRKTLNLVLLGASGRMGIEIQALIESDTNLNLVSRVDRGFDWRELKDARVDVLIDFSTPQGLNEGLKWCLKNRVALVSGTTGLSTQQSKALRTASKKIPVLYSANMSLGIAVITSMLENLAALTTWDFQVEEAHHIHKKDRPSGTAILLQDKLEKVMRRKMPAANSVRGGGIPGIHQVWAMGPDECLVLQHTAFKRTVFAQGAIHAARWLFDKGAPGLYDLTDLYKKT